MLPLLMLCMLWPEYIFNAFRCLVKRAQAVLQVMPFSLNSLVPTCKGLVRKLVIGWHAAA